jgi:type I restriction enzyme M protein
MARGRKATAQPLTTAQQLGSLIKSARDIMRKDKGLSTDLDRLPMLTWIMFLKFLDDLEQVEQAKAEMRGERYQLVIEPPYRWRDWAADDVGISGSELIAFIQQDEATRPDGTRGLGLFAYLRGLRGGDGIARRRQVIATVFSGVQNRMTSGYLLRDVLNKVHGIHFTSREEVYTLGHLYETMLREMRDAAGQNGEFYTPRPVVRFMIEMVDPTLGETVLDPACGTGGFLVEAYQHLEKQCQTVGQRFILQNNTLFGGEAKPFPYLLCQMNLLLHGLEAPEIDPENSLRFKLSEIGDKDRVDMILTNPPFGGEEEAGIKGNFPADMQTSETALLFLQLIMRKLRRPGPDSKPGRAGMVVPNGTLSGDGVCARIKEQLLKEFNLHTIVRLPNGVFAPYTPIPTNLMFFDRSGPTEEIWYYEIALPQGRKNYSKTKPMQYEEFADCIAWWHEREEKEHAWKIDFAAIKAEAVARAQPHWDAAEQARQQAAILTKEADDLSVQMRILRDRTKQPLFTAQVGGRLEREIESLLVQEREKRGEAADLRSKAIEEQRVGDAIYWPIYNLDLKNPNSTEALEHLPPEQLVEEILAKERHIIEIMHEIKGELAGTTEAAP